MIKLKTMTFVVAGVLCASAACAAVSAAKVFGPAALAARNAAPKPPAAASPVNLPALSPEQIIERNIAARGGLAAWHRVQSITLVGKMDAGKTRKDGGLVGEMTSPQKRATAKAQLRATAAGNAEGPAGNTIQLSFKMAMKRPLMKRLEIPIQGETAVQVFDGVQGWKLRPYLGRHEVEPFTADELKIAATQQELDGPLIDHVAKGTRVELDGTEKVDGHDSYRLKLTLKSGEIRHLWIDAQSFLDIRSEGAPRRWDGKMRPVLTYYRDFKTVDGLKIPHLLQTTMDGVQGAENIVVEQVAVNSTLNDALFKKPL